MKSNLEMLQRDKKHINQFSDRLDEIMPDLEEHYRDVLVKYQAAKIREEAYARCDKEQLASLDEAIEEQNTQIGIFTGDLESLEMREAELTDKIQFLDVHKAELKEAIKKAQAIREELKCLTPEDLGKLKENYNHLISIHLWTPVKVSAMSLELVYDQALRVVIDLEKLRCREPDGVQVALVDAAKGFVFGGFLSEVVAGMDKWRVSEILYHISSFWYKLTLLEKDISLLKLKFQTEAVQLEGPAVQTQITFFSRASRTKSRLNLLFQPSDVRVYPNLQAVQSECEVVYGDMSQSTVEQLVRRYLNRGDYGCIKDMCVEVRKLLP